PGQATGCPESDRWRGLRFLTACGRGSCTMTGAYPGATAMSGNKARGFLDDIFAHPDDDMPRLIFADWLDEQGEGERAEFIRVQVGRARLPHWDAQQVRLRLRERQLLAKHGNKWKAELPEIQGVTWEDFRRGFVATATF